MSAVLDALTAEALKLSPDERAELIERLAESMLPAGELHPEWDAEVERRLADLDAGRTQAMPADEVLGEVRALIAGHRAAP